MKIAFVAPYDFAIPGGVKNHTCQLAAELTQLGNTVHIIGASSKTLTPSEIPNFIQIGAFPKASKTLPIPPHILIKPTLIPRLQKILHDLSPDVIHLQEPLIPPLCLSVPFYKKAPIFATFHTYYEKGQPLYRLFKPLFNPWLNRLSGRIVVSLSAKSYIEQYFPYDYKVIPNGVNLKKFSETLPTSPLMDTEYFNVLFVGHAQFKRKGLRYLLEAYQILKKDYPMLRLIIAGTKWAGTEQPRELNGIELKDVHYLGTVSDDELIALYQTADLFCAPSLGNESFGMVLTEAMAAGTPIIASQIDGYTNVVRDGQEALLVPPKDSIALAKAIKRLIDAPTLRQHLAAQGSICVQRYAWSQIAKEVFDYYLEQL